MNRRRKIISVLVSLFGIALLVTGFLVRYPPDPLTLCQKMLDGGFVQWLDTNKTNAYPNVDGDSRRSFAEAGAYMKDGGTIYMSKYGYVPSLTSDDHPDLVLMYLKEKTRRTWNGDRSPTIFTKKKWMVLGPAFGGASVNGVDLPEGGSLEDTEGFKRRLQKTLDFLKENNRHHWQAVVKEHSEFLNSIQE